MDLVQIYDDSPVVKKVKFIGSLLTGKPYCVSKVVRKRRDLFASCPLQYVKGKVLTLMIASNILLLHTGSNISEVYSPFTTKIM